MKKILLSSLMAAAAAVPAFAGVDNINYQAVIKNGNEIVANSQVEMKFELLDNETVVYTEEQSMTTNASGLVSCQLGGDALKTIEWGDLTLRVSINFGSGYEVLSNETVSSVPTALYALRSADSDILREEIDGFANMVEYRFDKLQNQVDTLEPEIENLLKDNEETQSTLRNMSADVAQIEGLAKEIEDLNTNTDAFATMVETRFDKVQKQVDGIDKALEVSGTTDYSALIQDLEALKAQTEEGLAKVEVFADAVDAVEGLVAANEETEAKLRNMSADVAQIEGLAKEVEDLNTNTDAFASMVEERFDKVQGNVDANTKAIEELNEQVDAFATMNETRIDKLQKQVDTLEADIVPEIEGLIKDNEETKANIRSISADVAQVEGLAEKVEMLEESMAAIASPSDPESMMNQINNAMGELGETVEGLVKDNEETKANIRSISADVAQVEGLAEKVEMLEESMAAIASPSDPESMMNQINTAMGELGDAVEGLVQENEETKSRLNAISADVAQIEGLAKDVEALHEQTDDFATMLETRLDKIQNQVDGLEEEVTTLKDTLNQLIEALRDLDILPTLFNAGK